MLEKFANALPYAVLSITFIPALYGAKFQVKVPHSVSCVEVSAKALAEGQTLIKKDCSDILPSSLARPAPESCLSQDCDNLEIGSNGPEDTAKTFTRKG